MSVTSEIPEPAGTRRLVVFYVILAVITAAGVILVINQGKDEKAQPRIAGGYDAAAPTPCLGKTPSPTGAPLPPTAPAQPAVAGPSFDVKQSGQFVNLSNVQNTLGGKLRLHKTKGPNGGHPPTGPANWGNGKDATFPGH